MKLLMISAALATSITAMDANAADEVVVRHSRAIASIPFGVGQFQNGDTGLGVAFLIGEGLALTTATLSFVYHNSLPTDPEDAAQASRAASTSRMINWLSVGGFVGLAAGGVVQAQVSFRPEHRERASVHPIATPVAGGGIIGLHATF